MKRLPKGEKKFFFFFTFISHFSSPFTEKNKTTYFFRPFITGNRKTAKENVPYKIFFLLFFWLFCTLPLLVIGKIATYLFFRNSDFKYPKMPLSALKYHILQITFFPLWLRGHIHLPKHTPFFLTRMLKKKPA